MVSKLSVATFGMACLVAAPEIFAQEPPRGFLRRSAPPTAPAPASPPSQVSPGSTAPKNDARVFAADGALPEPTKMDELPAATVALPNDPIEPWLLTKEAGPFMVIAKTFRGPEAERYALALAMELRHDHGLPTYILRTKDFPARSNIRGVPPLTPDVQRRSMLTEPESVRSIDEAAVLVGNELTLAGSEALWLKVKKIKPKCLKDIPKFFLWRDGLNTATRTTNPYVPTQKLYPGRGKRDPLITQMNGGPRSVFNCPGRYTLQVAEFGGLAVFNPDKKDPRLFENSLLRKSPLVEAADKAEKLADRLANDPEVKKAGMQAYVYHNRTASKVLLGSFDAPNDPNAARFREALLQNAVKIAERSRMGVIIAPGPSLTDLQDPIQPIKLTSAP